MVAQRAARTRNQGLQVPPPVHQKVCQERRKGGDHPKYILQPSPVPDSRLTAFPCRKRKPTIQVLRSHLRSENVAVRVKTRNYKKVLHWPRLLPPLVRVRVNQAQRRNGAGHRRRPRWSFLLSAPLHSRCFRSCFISCFLVYQISTTMHDY